MSITETITALPTPPSRSDPTNFDTRADAFLGALPTLATEVNTWAGQANSTASTVSSDKSSAQAAAAAAAASSATATTQAGVASSARTAVDQALATVSGETASVVAHAATEDPHPLLDSRMIGQLGYLLDQIALETKRNVAQDAYNATQDAALASHESSNDDAIEATTGTLTYALDLISVVAKAVTGGRAAFLGGSAATPAITIGNAGIYQSAADTLSVALAGSEVLRVTTTGIKCVGGSVTAL